MRATFGRPGASVMGKRMFDAGEKMWPEEAPFHTPVFVVTHQQRAPWERPGGTTFHFVNDGIASALDRAREAAADQVVSIAGGGATILAYLNARQTSIGLELVGVVSTAAAFSSVSFRVTYYADDGSKANLSDASASVIASTGRIVLTAIVAV